MGSRFQLVLCSETVHVHYQRFHCSQSRPKAFGVCILFYLCQVRHCIET